MLNCGKFIWNTHCPRCKGNLQIEPADYGYTEICLQCGFRQDLDRNGKERQIVNKVVKAWRLK